jgi:trk system potassium uptake protein TrkH
MQLAQLLEPRGVFVASYDGRRVNASVLQSVTYFFFLFILSFGVLSLALAATGLDFTIAVSSAATAICNVGPGVGDVVGPAGNFSSLNETAKWLMAIGMLVGRLEVFSVFILLLPRFWQP